MPSDPSNGGYRPPPYYFGVWAVLGGTVVLTLGLLSLRFSQNPDTSRAYASRTLAPEPEQVLFVPEMDDEFWPCSDCHEGEVTNRKVRKLEDEHAEMEFLHGNLWCMHCHEETDRDKLHLADATPVAFEESWKLCTQCHAHKLAEWNAGVHGKRTGHWWGPKDFRTCIACHNPHSPPFAPLEPLPPPVRPEHITLEARAEETSGHEAH